MNAQLGKQPVSAVASTSTTDSKP